MRTKQTCEGPGEEKKGIFLAVLFFCVCVCTIHFLFIQFSSSVFDFCRYSSSPLTGPENISPTRELPLWFSFLRFLTLSFSFSLHFVLENDVC